jgi:syntaxin-binding protein 1
VDEHSQKLLGSVLKQNDILQEQIPSMFTLYSTPGYCAYNTIPVIELITNNRERQPDMEALYLLMPTTENVDRIIEDFPTAVIETAKNARQPKYADRHTDYQYKAAHVFFVDGTCPTLGSPGRDLPGMKALSDPLLEKLHASLDRRTEELHWLQGQRRDIAEDEYILKSYPPLFLNFWGTLIFYWCSPNTDLSSPVATEAQTFSLKTPELFFDLYSPPHKAVKARERFDQTLRLASKRVSPCHRDRHAVRYLTRHLDCRCLYHTERIPIHPILHACESWSTGRTKAERSLPRTTASRKQCKMAN